jgi:hypothetical protein
VPRHGEGLARKGAGTIRLWTVSFRKLGTIRSDGQNTRLNLCLVVQRSVRESDSEYGAKELSELSVLGNNFKHPQMRSPVSAQKQNLGNRSSQVSLSLVFQRVFSDISSLSYLLVSPSPQSQSGRYLNDISITCSPSLESKLQQFLKQEHPPTSSQTTPRLQPRLIHPKS